MYNVNDIVETKTGHFGRVKKIHCYNNIIFTAPDDDDDSKIEYKAPDFASEIITDYSNRGFKAVGEEKRVDVFIQNGKDQYLVNEKDIKSRLIPQDQN
jgi:hypothetical protein